MRHVTCLVKWSNSIQQKENIVEALQGNAAEKIRLSLAEPYFSPLPNEAIHITLHKFKLTWNWTEAVKCWCMLCPADLTASSNVQQDRQLGTVFNHCSKTCQDSLVTALSMWLIAQPLQTFPFCLQATLKSHCSVFNFPKNTCHLSTSTAFRGVWLTDTFQLDRPRVKADKHSIFYNTLHGCDCLHLKHHETKSVPCPYCKTWQLPPGTFKFQT